MRTQFWRPVQGKLASGLHEVEWLWDLQDLVEAHLLMDWQERADEERRRWNEKHPSK